MKDRILALAKGQFSYEPIKLQLSKNELRLVVVSGREISDTFTISNLKETSVKGFITSTNPLVEVTPQAFAAEKTEITVKFKTEELQEDAVLEGKLNIMTDCGEAEIPFEVTVVAPIISDKKGEVKDFSAFLSRVEGNVDDAALLFHSPHFKNVFLYKEEAAKYMYTHLVKRDSKTHSMDEFLVAMGKKKPFHFRMSQTNFEYQLKFEDVTEYISVIANTWGAACIHVYSEEKFLEPMTDVIWYDDFEKGKYELGFVVSSKRVKDGKHTGTIVLETPYQREEITVTIHKKTSIIPIEKAHTEKKYLWALEKNFLNYQMGNLQTEEYLNNIKLALAEMFESEDRQIENLRAYYNAMKKKLEDCEEYVERVNALTRPEYSDDTQVVMQYLIQLAIKSVYTEKEEDKKMVAIEARDFYENGHKTWRMFYFLLQVEERYQTLPAKLLLDEITLFLEKGCRSPFLYYEMVKIYKNDPSLLHELTRTNIQVLFWGTKNDLLGQEFALTLSFMAEHMKTFSEIVYKTLLIQYKKYRLTDTLQSICSMLIRCNKTGQEYFPWFAMGVQCHLKITELYEYYMYTFDLDGDTEIPPAVYTYFQYENHLNDKLKAYLFARIIKEKKDNPENYEAYKETIKEFALKQLNEKHLNKYLGVIYENMLKESMVRGEVALNLPQIMFKQLLTCNNPNMDGVYVIHLETEEAVFYPLIDGQAHIDIYTPNYQIYFADKENRYYVKSVDYRVRPVMNLGRMAMPCFENGSVDKGLMLHLLSKTSRRFSLKSQEAMICHMVVKENILSNYYQGKFLLKLLDHYVESHDDAMIRQVLEEMDVDVITPSRRDEIVEYMITYNLCQKAYDQVVKYGYGKIELDKLLRLADVLLSKLSEEDPFDETLYRLSHFLFQNKKKSVFTMAYLLKHYNGPIDDYFEIFSGSWLKDMVIEDEVCEKLLAQVLFVNANPVPYFQIFYDYYVRGINRILVKAFLCYVAYKYVVDQIDITEEFMLMLQKEATSTNADVMHLAVLKHFTEYNGFDDKQKEYLDYQLSRFVKEGVIMKFMQKFKGRIPLPYMLEKSVVIEHHISTKLPVNLLVYDEEGEVKPYQMKEVFPGVFVKEFLLFHGEEFRYQIYTEENGEKTKPAPLKALKDEVSKNSFYDLVNQMIDTKGTDLYEKACHEYEVYSQVSKKLLRPILQ